MNEFKSNAVLECRVTDKSKITFEMLPKLAGLLVNAVVSQYFGNPALAATVQFDPSYQTTVSFAAIIVDERATDEDLADLRAEVNAQIDAIFASHRDKTQRVSLVETMPAKLPVRRLIQ